MNDIDIEVDRSPTTYKGGTRYEMVRPEPAELDHSPRLPAQSTASIVQAILAQPAPVPHREPAAIKRERIEGAYEKSTPVMRAVASMLRSSKYLVLVAVVGMVAYVAIPSVSGVTITFATLVIMAGVLLVFDAMEYRHSQAGVERLRTQVDHKLETLHEVNRHVETLTAIKGDIEIKLKVLDLAAGVKQIADRGQKRLGRGE